MVPNRAAEQREQWVLLVARGFTARCDDHSEIWRISETTGYMLYVTKCLDMFFSIFTASIWHMCHNCTSHNGTSQWTARSHGILVYSFAPFSTNTKANIIIFSKMQVATNPHTLCILLFAINVIQLRSRTTRSVFDKSRKISRTIKTWSFVYVELLKPFSRTQ